MAARRKPTGAKQIDKRLGALRSDIAALQDDVQGLADSAGDAANDSARLAVHAAKSVAQRAYQLAEDVVSETAGDIETWSTDNLDSVRESVRTQPLSALLVAMGVGAVLSAIFLRSSQRHG